MIQFVEKGWEIFNGNIKGDEEGEYAFTGGNGNTVIDIVRGKEAREKIVKMAVGLQMDSDHQPLELLIRGSEGWRRKRKRMGRGARGYGIGKGVGVFCKD